jgi:hypothetical protein
LFPPGDVGGLLPPQVTVAIARNEMKSLESREHLLEKRCE